MPCLSDFQSLNISTHTARRVGRQLYPDYELWDAADNNTKLPGYIAMAILLAEHLIKLHVLPRDDAYSALIALRKPLTCYADKICPTIEAMSKDGFEKFSSEIASLEVLGGRYVRFKLSAIFDLYEQKVIPVEEFNPSGYLVWSHSVIPAGLYLALCMQKTQTSQEAAA